MICEVCGKKTNTMMIAMAEVLFMIDVETTFVKPDVTSGRKKLCVKCGNKMLKFLTKGKQSLVNVQLRKSTINKLNAYAGKGK